MSPEMLTVKIIDPAETASHPASEAVSPAEQLEDSPEFHGTPDASLLEDRLPEQWRLPRVVALMALCLGLAFCYFSNRPLWHTDLWGHLAYGQVIWQTGSLPATEPLMPLAEGMPFVDTAWLSQLLGLAAYHQWGYAGLQGLYGLSIVICLGLMTYRLWDRTGRIGVTLLGMGFLLALNWGALLAIRPQLAGMVCFTAVLFQITRRQLRSSDWWLIPLTFTLWANLHGSFLVGLALLGAVCAGRTWDVLTRNGSVTALVRDARWRHWLGVMELSAAATLLNPYGWRLHREVWLMSANPNLGDLTEWHAWDVQSPSGWWVIAGIVGLIFVYRHSRRRVAGWEGIGLLLLGIAAVKSERLLIWWSFLATYVLVLHGSAAWNRLWRTEPAPSPQAGMWTIVTIGLIWIAFGVSPVGRRLMHGSSPSIEKVVSKNTPIDAVAWLKEHPQKGLVFNIYEWGDYLLWAGPSDVKVFVNSHAHLVPREVWQTYMHVIEQQSGWEDSLERYGVNTIMLDTQYRSQLIRKLKDDAKWKIGYEDETATVLLRRKAI